MSELSSQELSRVRNAAKVSGIWRADLTPGDLVQRCAQDVNALQRGDLAAEVVTSLGANAVTAVHRTAPSFPDALYSAKQTTDTGWTTDAEWLTAVLSAEAQLTAEDPDPAVLANAWLERHQSS
ncbi:MAG: hypothetical protein U0R70_11160 [Solirubrobacteraceae bacterium]